MTHRLLIATILIMLVSLGAGAQSDTGGGLVLFASTLSQGRAVGREKVAFTDITTPDVGFSIFHSDRSSAKANVFFGLALLRRSFGVDYENGGLGGGNSTSARVDLSVFYFSCGPEFRADKTGKLTVRFGPMIGKRIGGRMSGESHVWGMGSGDSATYFQGESPSDFHGDLRLLFGVSHRAMLTENIGWYIDPAVHVALSSMLENYRTHGVDIVVNFGLFWRRGGSLVPADGP